MAEDEHWSERAFAYLAARRNGKRTILDFELRNALAVGEHVHMLDKDGEWCLDDCEVPLQPGLRSVIPHEVIWDEILGRADGKDVA